VTTVASSDILQHVPSSQQTLLLNRNCGDRAVKQTIKAADGSSHCDTRPALCFAGRNTHTPTVHFSGEHVSLPPFFLCISKPFSVISLSPSHRYIFIISNNNIGIHSNLLQKY
jgi:hypothetical protein